MEVNVIEADGNIEGYLTPIDVSTLQVRRSRQASLLYVRLMEAFLASGEAAMRVDVEKLKRKPATVRAALVKAVKTTGNQEMIRISLIGNEVFLVRR